MKTSIIVPSYNQGSFLKETLESIFNQNASEIEVLVIDGGSTDNSVDVIKQFDNQITFWVSEPDQGQSHAINKGFEKATGDIICWLNSDDLFTENTLKEVTEIFNQNPELDFIFGETQMFESNGNVASKSFNPHFIQPQMLAGVATSQPSYFFKKALLNKCGFLNETLHFGLDYDFFLRFALVGKYKYFNKIWSKYRLHQSSKTETSQLKFAAEWSQIFGNLIESSKFDSLKTKWKNFGFRTQTSLSYDCSNVSESDLNLAIGFALFHQAVFSNQGGNVSECVKILSYLKKDYPEILKHTGANSYYWRLKIKSIFH